ncbi:hypothetical protein HT031_001337 [Scenedesmus sp. PABB004]|nr:hypothetical protein HT031_001337 [Scenedesmus sp. PABB004]
MAEFKQSVHKCIALHLVFVMLKLAWYAGANAVSGMPFPRHVLGLAGGEGMLLFVLNEAKLGAAKESLALLKTFNMIQAFMTATEVLSAWIYHQGTHTGGVATYAYAHAVARWAVAAYPSLSPESALGAAKAAELFLDLTTSAFLALGTIVAHRMIVEKMAAKKDKDAARAAPRRAGAQRGGGDSDSDDSDADGGPPDAVPLEPRVVKAASTAKTAAARRRHA